MRLSVARRITFAVVAGLGVHAMALHGQVTVSGLGYVGYTYQLKADSSLLPAAHDNNFDVARAYITAMGKFADGVTMRITADVDGRKAATNQLTYRLKYAYVAWQPNAKGPLTYKIGEIHTPWIDWEENLYDYRFQGTTPFERAGYLSSSDFGAGVDGMWNYEQVNMQLGVYDGENYNNAPGDNRKDFEARVSVRLAKTDMAGRTGGIRLNAFADIGAATGGGTRQRIIGNISYKSKVLTLVAEAGLMQDSINATHPNQKGQVLAAYGVYNIPASKFALVGRIDLFDPNTDSTATALNTAGNTAANKQTRVSAGLSYAVNANFRFMMDADLNSLENGATNVFDRSRQALSFHTEFKF